MKNYGAQYKKICTMFPDRTPEECKRIDAAYYKAFPGVKMYHSYCYRRADEYPYTTNLFGLNYWGVNGHKLINLLVQGSAALLLKVKLLQVYEFLKDYKSKLQMNIHDEISILGHSSETQMFIKKDGYWLDTGNNNIFDQIKHIMETWEDTLVPIVAEMEISNTDWSEKKGVKK